MAGISFETDAISSLKGAIECLEETKTTLNKGAQASLEVSNESNVGRLIRSAQSMNDGVSNLTKTLDECTESFDKLVKYYNSLKEELE